MFLILIIDKTKKNKYLHAPPGDCPLTTVCKALFYLKTPTTLSSNRSAWRHAALRSLLLQSAASRSSHVLCQCTAINNGSLFAIFKDGDCNVSVRLADTCKT